MGATSEVLDAPYGYVIAQRCPVEHIHTRHILVRYQGARNADEDIDRSRSQAEARARELLAMAQGGADFESLAREHSEDASSERGGDLGITGRGRLAQAYEEAAYALTVGAITGPVETEFGFHVIQRVPE
jgi:parvulin-like peptidyl-prolyl isomerase